MTPPPDDRGARTAILAGLGASAAVAAELVAYTDGGFDADAVATTHEWPLPDEPFVATWDACASAARREGAVPVLRRMLPQLCFPVLDGMSERADYRAATRRGAPVAAGTGPAVFTEPAGVSIALHETPAGRLPVVCATARADFELLIRALTRRNEPAPLPRSMGACIVGGYNNWSRVAALREAWAARQGDADAGDATWQLEFQRIVPRRELYQDRFVVLSTGPYSGVPAADLGLDDDAWLRCSHVIRLEHECAHYFTRRVFGSMRNSLLDELVADYTGIVAARGRLERGWLERFLGVDAARFRPDGRLVNYRGTPALGDDAFAMLQQLVRRAARTLEEFDERVRGGTAARSAPRTHGEVAAGITAIAATGLEYLAMDGAVEALYAAYAALVRRELVPA